MVVSVTVVRDSTTPRAARECDPPTVPRTYPPLAWPGVSVVTTSLTRRGEAEARGWATTRRRR